MPCEAKSPYVFFFCFALSSPTNYIFKIYCLYRVHIHNVPAALDRWHHAAVLRSCVVLFRARKREQAQWRESRQKLCPPKKTPKTKLEQSLVHLSAVLMLHPYQGCSRSSRSQILEHPRMAFANVHACSTSIVENGLSPPSPTSLPLFKDNHAVLRWQSKR